MDIIELTRNLGAAIQQDERYLAFAAIREQNEKDEELMALMQELQLRQMNYQHLSQAETPDMEKLQALEIEFNDLYTKFMSNEKMVKYEAARKEIDDMMNYIMAILGGVVNGADPATYEPEQHSCGCGCEDCGSDCGGHDAGCDCGCH